MRLFKIRRAGFRILAATLLVAGTGLLPVIAAAPAQAAPASSCSSRFDSTWSRGWYWYASVDAGNVRSRRMTIDIAGPTTNNGEQAHIWPWYDTGSNTNNSQYWCLRRKDFPDGSYAYWVRNYRTGLCLDLNGGTHANGVRVVQWGCNSTSSQWWDITAKGQVGTPDGTKTGYYFRSDSSVYCLDVKQDGGYNNYPDGTPLQIWSCKYSTNQLFY